jgi:hypothetical protein
LSTTLQATSSPEISPHPALTLLQLSTAFHHLDPESTLSIDKFPLYNVDQPFSQLVETEVLKKVHYTNPIYQGQIPLLYPITYGKVQMFIEF